MVHDQCTSIWIVVIWGPRNLCIHLIWNIKLLFMVKTAAYIRNKHMSNHHNIHLVTLESKTTFWMALTYKAIWYPVPWPYKAQIIKHNIKDHTYPNILYLFLISLPLWKKNVLKYFCDPSSLIGLAFQYLPIYHARCASISISSFYPLYWLLQYQSLQCKYRPRQVGLKTDNISLISVISWSKWPVCSHFNI